MRRSPPQALLPWLVGRVQSENAPRSKRQRVHASSDGNWPVGAGETVLGEMQTERRLHSLYSAAREIAVPEELLEPFLIEAGALTAGDPRNSNRRVFGAEVHPALLAESDGRVPADLGH